MLPSADWRWRISAASILWRPAITSAAAARRISGNLLLTIEHWTWDGGSLALGEQHGVGEGSGDWLNITTCGLQWSTLGLPVFPWPVSHQTSLDSIFYLGSVVWHNICQDNISRSLNSVLATVKIPSAELGRAQLAENVLVPAVSFHYSQFPPYSVHCWRGSSGGLLQEMFCGCQRGPSHVPLETNLAAMCKLASSVEVCKYI